MKKLVCCLVALSLSFSLWGPMLARADEPPPWAIGSPGAPYRRLELTTDRRAAAQRMKYAGIALTVLGAALGACAFGLGVSGARQDDDTGMMLAIGGMAAGGISGGLLVIGGVLWGVGDAREGRLPAVALAPIAGGGKIAGGALSLTFRF